MDIIHAIWQGIRPVVEGLFYSGIPFNYRWRMVHLGFFSFIDVAVHYTPWLFSRAYKVHWIPNRHGDKLRCLVFEPPRKPTDPTKLRPLHLSIHGGGFIGGIAESSAFWAHMVAKQTGSVVIASTYRFAPKHVYPAAHDDTDDIVQYLIDNGEKLWQADPHLLTVSGLSAGGALALATAQQPHTRPGEDTSIKACVAFFPPVCRSDLLVFFFYGHIKTLFHGFDEESQVF